MDTFEHKADSTISTETTTTISTGPGAGKKWSGCKVHVYNTAAASLAVQLLIAFDGVNDREVARVILEAQHYHGDLVYEMAIPSGALVKLATSLVSGSTVGLTWALGVLESDV